MFMINACGVEGPPRSSFTGRLGRQDGARRTQREVPGSEKVTTKVNGPKHPRLWDRQKKKEFGRIDEN